MSSAAMRAKRQMTSGANGTLLAKTVQQMPQSEAPNALATWQSPAEFSRRVQSGESEVRRVPTGVSGLDAKLGRGIQAGSTVLLLAEACQAPYTLCEQFSVTGLQLGERILYYSLERPQSETEPRIKSLATDKHGPIDLHFIDCYSQRLKDIDEATLRQLGVRNHSPPLPEHLLSQLLQMGHRQPFRLVLESLSEAIEVYGLAAGMSLLKRMAAVVRTIDGVALILMIRGEQPESVEARARHLADAVIELGREGQGLRLHTYLHVSKWRGPEGEGQVLAYKVGRKGLILDTFNRLT